MRYIFSFLFFAFIYSFVFSQDVNVFKSYEDSLQMFGKVITYAKDDSLKYRANKRFEEILKKSLVMPGAFNYKFDSLKTAMHLYSADKKLRIFTWHVPKSDGTYEYHGIIQMKNRKEIKLIELIDKSDEVQTPFTENLDAQKWYGALYYDMVSLKANGERYYTLLGWKGNSKLTNKKVIDILKFDKSGKPCFGEQLFIAEKTTFSRIIFEYSAQVTMSLKFYKKGKMIIFDHLSPPSQQMTGQPQFYGPDMSYDAFILKKGKWNLQKDVDARNPKDKAKEKKDKKRDKPKMGIK
ncbi:MAG: hypothetical protein PHD97_09945 [Bacteroidales bacterium]|nr:hypothetical protein [Bacteroidales bacterium]